MGQEFYHSSSFSDSSSQNTTACDDDDDDYEQQQQQPQPQQRQQVRWYNQSSEVWKEARLFLELASVSSLMNLGSMLSNLLTASYIGRQFEPVYLSAFTLANLTGNLCTFSVLAGLFSASDTLSPQAFGRGEFQEVGRIAVRGYTIALSMLLPINILLYGYLEPIMIALGQDAEASFHAGRWYRVFVLTLPFSILFNSLWKFLTAQHIMKPLIFVSVLCTGIFLPVCLHIGIETMGFMGSALANVVFQATQALLLLGYVCWIQPHEARTWPSLTTTTTTTTLSSVLWKFVSSALLDWKRMKEFLYLGMGGIVAQCEWIFWESVTLLVGRLGVVTLSAHTITIQTSMAFWMIPISFGTALAIRMGISLSISVKRTQRIVLATLLFSVVLFGLISVFIYVSRDTIVGLFTTDKDVEEMTDAVWGEVSWANFIFAIFGLLTGVATGLGKQWPLGIINFFNLWLFGLPVMYYTAIILDQGLDSVWFWMNIPYLSMNIMLIALFVGTDWHSIRKQMLLSSDNKKNAITTSRVVEERTPLL